MTHLLGLLGAIAGCVFLVLASLGDGPKVTSMALYGGSMVSLFGASTLYHSLDLGVRGNAVLRRLDHAAIFLLIAGTYMPALMHLLDGAWRLTMLSVVGGGAVAGMLFKVMWIRCPDWLGTLLYLLLGWSVVVPAHLIVPQLSMWQLGWLVAGGLAYTVGAIVFVMRWPDPWPEHFGHHEVWHVFVLAGAGAHFLFTTTLLDAVRPGFG